MSENDLVFTTDNGGFFSGTIDMKSAEMVCVPSKEQYAEVDLCLKDGMNFQVAEILGKSLSFAEKKKLGKEIESRWNQAKEIDDLREKVSLCEDENCPSAKQVDKHARINKAVSDAIGNDGPMHLGSWHDLGAKVAAVVAQLTAERERVELLSLALGEIIPFAKDAFTFYDNEYEPNEVPLDFGSPDTMFIVLEKCKAALTKATS